MSSALDTLVSLHDLDLLLEEARDLVALRKLNDLGFEIEGDAPLARMRTKLVTSLERRWLNVYERAQRRYGRGVAAVRERVCQGCFITLPTSVVPAPDSPTMCESCGRILCWR